MSPVRAYVGLGANLGRPEAQIAQALYALASLPDTRLVRASSLYRSAPVDASGPEYANAVAEVETSLGPAPLLQALLDIETRFGRERPHANAPRTLDLDLLLYGDQVIGQAGLTVPHPRMHRRAFVLAPLVEIAPDAVVPGHGRAAELLAHCAGQRVERMA